MSKRLLGSLVIFPWPDTVTLNEPTKEKANTLQSYGSIIRATPKKSAVSIIARSSARNRVKIHNRNRKRRPSNPPIGQSRHPWSPTAARMHGAFSLCNPVKGRASSPRDPARP
ncbi:hypothetical protein GWI33_013952 [Rhynchophorus ferrugineus]|uniref:Uncharacterized protein n=1 Tax=Rhynchophorus ferrugineus TaxID=354439 RepID=A0A834I2Q0_RHYFE|nr:hypothetical protein GWI33_013952 [Rhynchophorus ferrugineus]